MSTCSAIWMASSGSRRRASCALASCGEAPGIEGLLEKAAADAGLAELDGAQAQRHSWQPGDLSQHLIEQSDGVIEIIMLRGLHAARIACRRSGGNSVRVIWPCRKLVISGGKGQ